jgi:hypothetical protein
LRAGQATDLLTGRPASLQWAAKDKLLANLRPFSMVFYAVGFRDGGARRTPR